MPSEITLDWINYVLGKSGYAEKATGIQVDPNFGSSSLIGQVSRVTLSFKDPVAEPLSLVVKFPSSNLALRERVSSRRIYEREALVYKLLSTGPELAVPRLIGTFSDTDESLVVHVLEDLTPATTIPQSESCPVEVAQEVLSTIAKIHSTFWGDQRVPKRNPEAMKIVLGPIIEVSWEPFVERYAPEPTRLLPAFAWVRENLLTIGRHLTSEPGTLFHGDLHTENILFMPGHRTEPKIIDWQLSAYGLGASDVNFFLVNSLSVEDRRRSESGLLRDYYSIVQAATGDSYPFERFELDYRAATTRSIIRPVNQMSAFAGLQDRDDQIQFTDVLFDRISAAIIDHDPVEAMLEAIQR